MLYSRCRIRHRSVNLTCFKSVHQHSRIQFPGWRWSHSLALPIKINVSQSNFELAFSSSRLLISAMRKRTDNMNLHTPKQTYKFEGRRDGIAIYDYEVSDYFQRIPLGRTVEVKKGYFAGKTFRVIGKQTSDEGNLFFVDANSERDCRNVELKSHTRIEH